MRIYASSLSNTHACRHKTLRSAAFVRPRQTYKAAVIFDFRFSRLSRIERHARTWVSSSPGGFPSRLPQVRQIVLASPFGSFSSYLTPRRISSSFQQIMDHLIVGISKQGCEGHSRHAVYIRFIGIFVGKREILLSGFKASHRGEKKYCG